MGKCSTVRLSLHGRLIAGVNPFYWIKGEYNDMGKHPRILGPGVAAGIGLYLPETMPPGRFADFIFASGISPVR